MEKKRKADEAWDDKQILKKSRRNSEELEIFQIFPQEILQIILLYVEDPLSIVLVSLTSKRWNNLVSQSLTNRRWYEVYLASRKRFKVNIDGTLLDQVLKSVSSPNQNIFEWDFEIYDSPVTRDCMKIQQDLVAEDEYLAKFPIKYFFDQSDYTLSMDLVDTKHKNYDPAVDYKQLALKCEAKYRQFELWRDTKPVVEAFKNSECSCLKEENELALYDEKDEEIVELESKLDVDLDWDWDRSLLRDILNSKDFDYSWDERSHSESDEEMDASESDVIDTNSADNDKNDDKDVIHTQESEALKTEVNEDESDVEDESEYDSFISIEQRDKIFENVSSSERSLKLFIHVLSAVLMGHCPAPCCPDSALISTAKFERFVVRTGDVVDEVVNQLKYATTLDQSSSIISTMICALQKLRMVDLLFLKQGAEKKYPYLSSVYSVFEVENNISEVFYLADKQWGFNFPQQVNPWTSYFQADIATDDDFETMPDWLSIRHGIHRLMRKGGVFCATPNATEFAVHILSEFIHRTLSSVVSEKKPNENVVDVGSEDILKALEMGQLNRTKQTIIYTDKSDLHYENPIVMNSDSEDYSDESSSVDSDWVDEPIMDLEEGDTNESIEDEDYNDDPMRSIVQESLKKCVQHAQFDAKEDPEDFEISVMENSDEEDDSVDERIIRHMVELWDETIGQAPDHDDKTAYYMQKNLVEDAIVYSGQELQEEDALAQLFIHKYEDDIPFHDMSDEQRNKILELRKQTNRMIKEQCEEEFRQLLTTKCNRMKYNARMYDSSIRSDANECKTMIVDLNDEKALKHTIHKASQIIRSSSVLKSIKLMNLQCANEKQSALIAQLMSDIASSPTITSVVLFNCHFTKYGPLIDLIQKNKLTKFHMMFPINLSGNDEDLHGANASENEFLFALQNQESITDLMLPIVAQTEYPVKFVKISFVHALKSMLPRLRTLHLWDTRKNPAHAFQSATCTAIADILNQPHQLNLIVLHSWCKISNEDHSVSEIMPLLQQLNIKYAVKTH